MSTASPELIQSWAGDDSPAAFVVSTLLRVGGEVSKRVQEILQPLVASLSQSSQRGQKTIYHQLNST